LEPSEVEQTLEDVDASLRAYEKRAITGDNIPNNLYERPFTAYEMLYQPDINILTVSVAADENFFYFTMVLDGLNPDVNALTGTYGIEFDRTKTGRGDLLVWVHSPQEEWSLENLIVFTDLKGVVGGPNPILANEGFEGEVYKTTLLLEGDRVAYARILQAEQPNLQFAISRELLDNAKEFLWGGWADNGLKNPLLFDYNDHLGPSQAGSPIRDSGDYPLKELYILDNTCRLPYGFTPDSNIPGLCSSAIPQPIPQSAPPRPQPGP